MMTYPATDLSTFFQVSMDPVALLDPHSGAVLYATAAFTDGVHSFQLACGKHPLHEFQPLQQLMAQCLHAGRWGAHDALEVHQRIEMCPVHVQPVTGPPQLLLQCRFIALSGASTRDSHRAVLETLPGNWWACSVNGEVFWTSEQANIYACGSPRPPDVAHQNHMERLHPDDVQLAMVSLGTGMADGCVPPFRYRFRHHLGHYEWFVLLAQPMRDSGGSVLYWLCQSVNIHTQMLEVQRLQSQNHLLQDRLEQAHTMAVAAQKMELVTHLAGGIAHDLNNMLFVMRMHMSRLARHLAGSTWLSDVKSVQECISKAARMSTQLSGFSGRLPQNAAALHTGKLLEDLHPLLLSAVGAEVQFTVSCAPQLPAVMADRGYLENVLLNLLINARDAVSGSGEVALQVGVLRRNDGQGAQDFVAFSVVDDGVGMSSELQAKIFQPFFTTKPAGRGTGLGLAMAKNFAENSGGSIEVESHMGRGTTIRLLLPVAGVDVPELHAQSQRPAAQVRGSGSVMLVEDDEAVRQALSLVLREQGYHIVAALNPDQAIGLLEVGVLPDLVLSDIRMPGQHSVLDLIAYVQVHRPMPMLFVTGYSADLAISEGLLLARYPVLFKPVELDALLQQVQHLLQCSHTEQDTRARSAQLLPEEGARL